MKQNTELNLLKAVFIIVFKRLQQTIDAQNNAWIYRNNILSNYSSKVDDLNEKYCQFSKKIKKFEDKAEKLFKKNSYNLARNNVEKSFALQCKRTKVVTERKKYNDLIQLAACRYKQARNELTIAIAKYIYISRKLKLKLEKIKIQDQTMKCKDMVRKIAKSAGVPNKYVDNVIISYDDYDNINIYFGGIDEPGGKDHGHYNISSDGIAIYQREPEAPHGKLNFKNYELYINQKKMLDFNLSSLENEFKAELELLVIKYHKADVKIHKTGKIAYVRDFDGTVLYDSLNNIGYLSPNLR